jgi:four helix bundle protein
MGTHKDLDVWKLGIQLVKDIYATTAKFPQKEMYGLTSQLRRAAVSVPSNIAEGAARNGKKEFIQFLYISLGSLSEIETLLIIAEDLNYFGNSEMRDRVALLRMKMLNLIKYLKSKSIVRKK